MLVGGLRNRGAPAGARGDAAPAGGDGPPAGGDGTPGAEPLPPARPRCRPCALPRALLSAAVSAGVPAADELSVAHARLRVVNTVAVLGALVTAGFLTSFLSMGTPLRHLWAGLALTFQLSLVPVCSYALRARPELQEWVPLLLMWASISAFPPLAGNTLGHGLRLELCEVWMAMSAGLVARRAGVAAALATVNFAAYWYYEQTHDPSLQRVDYSALPAWAEEANNFVSAAAAFALAMGTSLAMVRATSRTRDRLQARVVALKEAQAAQARAEGARKQMFMTMVSHELRTPLNGILALSDLLVDSNLRGDAEGRDAAETVQRSARALMAIVDDVLAFAKGEAGTLVLVDEEFDPGDAVEAVAMALFAEAEEKCLPLLTRVDTPRGLRVRGDSRRLQQVLNNLVSNAIKFTDRGSVTLSVAAAAGGEQLRFAVADSGVGIAPDALDSIFDAFRQADESVRRRYGGTGLGLAICQSIVQRMGGRLTVASEVGRGSEFVVEVPCVVASRGGGGGGGGIGGRVALRDASPLHAANLRHAVEREGGACRLLGAGESAAAGELLVVDEHLRESVPAAARPRAALLLSSLGLREDSRGEFGAVLTRPVTRAAVRRLLGSGSPLPAAYRPVVAPEPSRKTAMRLPDDFEVLVAEDNRVNRKVLGRLLDRLGARHRMAVDGQQAVEMFKERAPALVLMDCHMPVMDGFQAARAIRALDKDVPIIAQTADVFAHKDIQEAGMSGVLIKPLQLTAVQEAMLGCLS